MEELYLKEDVYKIIGFCKEVSKILGKGHREIIYGNALDYKFNKVKIPFNREMTFHISYKNIILSHYYYSDFVIFDEIILEIKAITELSNRAIKQILNYLAAPKNKLRLLMNFGEGSLKYRRIIF